DAVVFVAETPDKAAEALKAVLERACEALKGVPEETRAANPDGTTRYMRPRPGAARMYPETDIPPIQITGDVITKLRQNLPELPEQKLQRLMRQYSLNQKLARQLLDLELGELFETIAKESKALPTTIAVFLTENMKALKREGVPTEKVSEIQLKEMFKALASGELAKEALPEVFTWLAQNEGKTLQEAIRSLKLEMLPEEEIERIVDKVVEKNRENVEKREREAFNLIVSLVMREIRGKAKPERVIEIVKKKLETLGSKVP
ncbi:MAG: Glu-tRNA(Gln) amidotransferase GatDE subunit E, partial [Candidatus Bathyarchaeia archaeon]